MKNLRWSALGLALALAACGGGNDGGGTGKLSLQVTDAPVDGAQHVVVRFEGVEYKPANGSPQRVLFSAPKDIDLLALAGGNAAPLITDVVVPAGRYEWIRLLVQAQFDNVLDSYIQIDGAQHELRVPSGAETGLKLNTGLIVPQGGEADFTIDFDLRRSVVEPTGQPGYLLKPVLRLVDNSQVGTLEGTVDASVVAAQCLDSLPAGTTGAVYLFAGAAVSPDDADLLGVEPLASSALSLEAGGSYSYKIAFLNPGSYTVAYTCDAAADLPESSETLEFFGTATVSISTNASTSHHFTP